MKKYKIETIKSENKIIDVYKNTQKSRIPIARCGKVMKTIKDKKSNRRPKVNLNDWYE